MFYRTFIAALAVLLSALEVQAQEQELVVDVFQVTNSPSIENTPTLGRDATSDLIVFSRRDTAQSTADIAFTRIFDGVPLPRALTIPGLFLQNGDSDDVLNDIDAGRVVFTAYTSPTSLEGVIVSYNIITAEQVPLGSADQVFESRIHGDYVIWHEGTATGGRVVLRNLATGAVQTLRSAFATLSVDVGSQLAVYSAQLTSGAGQSPDVFAYDLGTGGEVPLPSDPSASDFVPRTFGPWVTWQVSDLFGSRKIVAYNVESQEFRTIIDDGSAVFSPAIDGDLIAYEARAPGAADVDVYAYRISDAGTYAVTNAPGNQFLTDVFDERVSFLDDRNGTTDVYYANLSFVDPPPPFECPGGGEPNVCDLSCGPLTLSATKLYGPSRWTDGVACLCEPKTFMLPSELSVLQGNSGNHWTDLIFDEGDNEVLCRYRGGSDQAHPVGDVQISKGQRYVFDFCTDGSAAGDTLTTQHVRLYLANGDSDLGITEVEATLEQSGCGDTTATLQATSGVVRAFAADNEASGCAAGSTPFFVAFLALLGLRRRRVA
ncbi:MAG: hypothetical protein AAF658_11910 [Myxococcota bacterium]